MPETTPNRGYPYPTDADQIDVAGDIQRLAEALDSDVAGGGPVGSIIAFAGDVAPPAGYLWCRGQLESRTERAELFAVIGIAFGAGDGISTFAVPNLQAYIPIGRNTGVNVPPGVSNQAASPVGTRIGSFAAVLPVHHHDGANHLHVAPDHLHILGINTSGQSENHVHNEGGLGTLIRSNPFAPQYFVNVTTGAPFPQQIAVDTIDTTLIYTGGNNVGHLHGVNGTTGASDRPLTTGGADRPLTTSDVGVDPANGNMQPALVLNYIIRA